MKQKIWIAAAAVMMSVSVFAQTPSDESVDKLVQVMQIEKQLSDAEAVISMYPAARREMDRLFESLVAKRNDLTDQQKQQLQAVLDDFFNRSGISDKAQAVRRLVAAYRAAVQSHLTQEEVDAMTAFYSSPIGRSIAEKQLAVNDEFDRRIAPLTEQYLNNLYREFRTELLPKIRQITDTKPTKPVSGSLKAD